MTDHNVIHDEDLIGAIETVERLISMMRELQARGIAPTVEEMALASVHEDDGDPLRTVARLSLLLAVALQRAAAQ